MRIVHLGPCDVQSGGPTLSTWLTIKGLRLCGVTVDLVSTPVKPEDLINQEINPIFCKSPKYGKLAFVPELSKTLDNVGDADIYHVQGLWMLQGGQMANYAMRHNKPYVVTLRGMLYPQALRQKRVIKRISRLLYQNKILRNASAIQCTCLEEMQHYRVLGFTNPVAIIPNPIDLESVEYVKPTEKTTFRIGYLGRFHPRKRIERILYSMKNLEHLINTPSEVVLIGGGDSEYEKFLHNEADRLGLKNVRFTGFLSGSEKAKVLSDISVLVVPSDFENFGNIVTEALASGVPVIASKGTPWQILEDTGCGWHVSNDQATLDKTILEAYKEGDTALIERGYRGRKMVDKHFSVRNLGAQMQQLYQWLGGEGAKPEFVYTV